MTTPAARERSPAEASHVVPWLVSAESEVALEEQIERLRSVEADPLEMAQELAFGRAAGDHRAVLIGGDRVATGRVKTGGTAFMFTGQGAQRAGMGTQLREAFPGFGEALDEVNAAFGYDVLGDALDLDATENTQPALFAIEVALFRLAGAFGLKPDYLIGHSIGEVSAAHVAGILSLTDAAILVSARAALMGALPTGGAMVSVRASEDDVLPTLPSGLSIAAVNAPNSVVVSGDADAAKAWSDRVDWKTTELRVSHAFHSHLMDPMLDEFREVARGLTFEKPQISIVSAMGELTDPESWVRQVREPVRFADGVRELQGAGVTRLLELGPDGILSALAGSGTPALRRKRPEAETFVRMLAAAWVSGAEVDWRPLLQDDCP